MTLRQSKNSNFRIIFLAIIVALMAILTVAVLKSNNKPKTSGAVNATCNDTFNIPGSKCNEGCSVDSDCEAGLACVASVSGSTSSCKNPKNPTAADCQLPAVSCAVCQNQVDVFWGPVLLSLNGARYSYPLPSRLIDVSGTGVSNYKACNLVATPKLSAVVPPSLPAGCQDPVKNGYLTATIDRSKSGVPTRYVQTVIKNTTTKCTYDVGVAAYKANYALAQPALYDTQNLFDSKTAKLSPGQSITLRVKVPTESGDNSCYKLP